VFKNVSSELDSLDITYTKLTYWRNYTLVWIKVPFIPANGEARVYMYYGNPDAESESNGTEVFEFFDDFEGTMEKRFHK